eukprot:200606_1
MIRSFFELICGVDLLLTLFKARRSDTDWNPRNWLCLRRDQRRRHDQAVFDNLQQIKCGSSPVTRSNVNLTDRDKQMPSVQISTNNQGELQTNAHTFAVSPIKYKVLALPPIAGFDSNPLYQQRDIYITKGNDSGLMVYQYNIQTNKWREFYNFGYAVQCCDIGNAIDSINNYLYVISKCKHSFNTILCGLNLHTKKFIFKKVNKKDEHALNRSDHLLMAIPSLKTTRQIACSELHLLYGSSINHMRIDVKPSRYASKYQEYDGIGMDLCCAPKSIYVAQVGRIFVFHSDAIWYSNVEQHGTYEWRLYKQRLPHKTCDYGVVQGFSYLVFLVYYNADNSIWCLDLLTGAMVKCDDAFPLRGFQRIRMLATVDDDAHFMLINEDYAWVKRSNRGHEEYANTLTGRTTFKEPEIWMNPEEDVVDPSKPCNFHISLDLLDVVPRVIRQKHKKIHFDLITWFIAQHKLNPKCFAVDLIRLIARFISRF